MVTAKESQAYKQISAWNLSYPDHMLHLQHEQTYGLPQFPSPALTAKVAFPGQSTGPFSGQQYAVGGFLNRIPPYYNISHPTGIPSLNTQCTLPHNRLSVAQKTVDTSSATEKKFLIFDQSGSHTRLFFSPSFSPPSLICSPNTPPSANGLCGGVTTQAVGQDFIAKPIEERWDENHITDEEVEDEILEDTEEINALLYSDSYDDDDDDEYDEVTSTGHSPFITEHHCNKDKSLEDHLTEEASSDQSRKRQRLLNGNYKKPSLESAPTRQPISCCYEDDMESICAGNSSNSYHDINLYKSEKKLKIRRALKVLESMIPELNNKNPLSIIDSAIIYLKSMRAEAEALGFATNQSHTVSRVAKSLDQWGQAA